MNFEALITAALESGTTPETLADTFAKALNTATAKQRETDAWQDLMDKMDDTLENGDFSESAAANLVIDSMVEYDGKWDAEDAEGLYEFLTIIFPYIGKFWNAIYAADNEIGMYVNILKLLEELKGDVNKREKEGEPAAPVGFAGLTSTDDEKLRAFLASLT